MSEFLPIDSKSGALEITSSNTGSPAKPLNFSGVTVSGLPVSSGGSGTVTNITATFPIVITPSPLTTIGVISINPAGLPQPGGSTGQFQLNGGGIFEGTGFLTFEEGEVLAYSLGFRFVDTSDPTKKLAINMSNMLTGTDAELLIPASNAVAVSGTTVQPKKFVQYVNMLGQQVINPINYSDLAGQPVIPSYTVATLPVGPTVGQLAVVTDGAVGAWGSPIIGGGAGKAIVWWNGTNWTVLGK